MSQYSNHERKCQDKKNIGTGRSRPKEKIVINKQKGKEQKNGGEMKSFLFQEQFGEKEGKKEQKQ